MVLRLLLSLLNRSLLQMRMDFSSMTILPNFIKIVFRMPDTTNTGSSKSIPLSVR